MVVVNICLSIRHKIRKINTFVFKRHKSLSSAEWLERRIRDPYIEKTKMEHYRCRSAFKLLEIDDRYKIIKSGHCAIDVGAAPGSWSQVLVKRTNSLGKDLAKKKGEVISIDLSPISSIEGAQILSNHDFTLESSQQKLLQLLNGRKPDLVLSDMSPRATGVKYLDQENSFRLALAVLIFSIKHLKNGGTCLIKMWEGQHEKIARDMKRFFNLMNYVKPKASQNESSEIYLLARNFKGLEKPE